MYTDGAMTKALPSLSLEKADSMAWAEPASSPHASVDELDLLLTTTEPQTQNDEAIARALATCAHHHPAAFRRPLGSRMTRRGGRERYRRALDAWALDHDGNDEERRRRQRLLDEECADDGAIAAALGGAQLERNESRELDQSILSRVGELVVGTLSPRINSVPCAPDAAAANADRSRLEQRCVCVCVCVCVCSLQLVFL
jgi:hypothetical protein